MTLPVRLQMPLIQSFIRSLRDRICATGHLEKCPGMAIDLTRLWGGFLAY